MGLNMSAEAFLLFALAVIYCAISFPGIAGQTRARPRRQHSSVDERVGKRRGISNVMASERSDSRNMPGKIRR